MSSQNKNDLLVQLKRAKSLANVQLFTIELQIRRLRDFEPEDEKFVLRWWSDLQFLILSLTGLRRAASIANSNHKVAQAINEFDNNLSGLKEMRDVTQHVDEYAVDKSGRHNKDINRKMLEVGSWNDPIYEWLGKELNIDIAYKQSIKLFKSIQEAFNTTRNEIE
ncbi:MAG: hypothetical protein JJ953_09870 [Gracilimonas sp.]|uniref:hypothetical protein n=1 Tax=Gracilimonas TaxID=649462 RepID=UPI001B1D779A|nr:hypothetical protein [Gracilimonas sp.]MBO6586399.1 hypothetical protein [Gracilimonas sp.]MBO6615056.1 hypothetical protein [Gracilimonas sp.]